MKVSNVSISASFHRDVLNIHIEYDTLKRETL